MKKIINIFIIFFVLLFCISGCKENNATPSATEKGANPVVWESVSDNYIRDGSNENNSTTLEMKYINNDKLIFQFNINDDNDAKEISFPGVMEIYNNDIGHFETDPEIFPNYKLLFKISNNGKKIVVEDNSISDISFAGTYRLYDNDFTLTHEGLESLFVFLPYLAPELNNKSDYNIIVEDNLLEDTYFVTDVNSKSTDTKLARFYIAKDLSVIYQIYEGVEPVVVFSSSSPNTVNSN